MKTFTSILVLVVLVAGLWWWGAKNNMGEKTEEPIAGQFAEFCFAKFSDSLDSDFQDKYTLRMKLEGDKAEGELRLLPAEKDALIGKFAGTVSAEDEATNSSTAFLVWDTEGEGMTAKQELRVILEKEQAKIGFGEMKLGDRGVYMYADTAKIDYSFTLAKVSCMDFNEREAVEKYLWENIAKLSPVAPAVGGNWYVVAATIDLEKNSGLVTYEDGHIQEKRNFSYVLKENRAVESLTIEE